MDLGNSHRLHVFFSYSAERSFKLLIRRNQVPQALTVSTSDYLMHGPIQDLYSGTKRKTWIEEFDPRYFDPYYLNDEDNAGYDEYIDQFWQTIEAHTGPITIWTSCENPNEWTGYIAVLNKLNRFSGIEVIDVSKLPSRLLKSECAGSLNQNALINALSTARSITEDDVRNALLEFDRLANEPPTVRLIENGELVSAKNDCLDDLVLSYVTNTWQKPAMVVGRVMGHGMFLDDKETNYPVSDWFITVRLVGLVEAGIIEAKGDPYEIRLSEVRLPQNGAAS